VPKYLNFAAFCSDLLVAEEYILRYIMYCAHALASELFRIRYTFCACICLSL